MKNVVLKITSLVFVLMFCLSANAQQKKVAARTPEAPTVSKRDTLLCKDWKLQAIEEFGVMNRVSPKQQNDRITFGMDKKVTLVTEGTEKIGTWSADRGFNAVNVNFEQANEKRVYKVIKLSPDSLIVLWQDPALVKTKFLYLKN